MNATTRWIAFASTLVIALILPVYTWLEPQRQADLELAFQEQAVESAVTLYAENCALCHGAAGEGIGTFPALDSDALRTASESDLFKTISRGLPGTLMAAWAVDEGGVFSNPQVEALATMIQVGSWDYVAARVEALGLAPPAMVSLEVSDEMRSAVEALPDGSRLAAGLAVYAENCAACHGANGAGTLIAPAVDSEAVRSRSVAELEDLVRTGVPGTLMAGWDGLLDGAQIDAVIALLLGWPALVQAGVEFPQAEMVFASTPEMAAAGEQLYAVACKACHGTGAYGTPMAPALNNSLFLSETPDAAIYQIIAGGVPGTMMPAWGSRLDDPDLQSLVAFLRSLEPDAPAVLPPILGP